jgi:guanylate kinase
MSMKAKGLLIVVTGPSAVGKGTICRALLQVEPSVRFSVSCTTRKARQGEVNGVEYFFVTHEEFHRKVEHDELLEHAEVYGNFYGTPRAYVDEMTDAGNDIILDIDMVGARSVREQYPGAVSVFVIPPSMATLSDRISSRGTESAEAVSRRLAEAPRWVQEGLHYDYVIVNDDLKRAVTQLQGIIQSEKCRTVRQGGALIRRLIEKGALN